MPTGFIRPYSSKLGFLFRVLDALVIAGTLYLAGYLYNIAFDSLYVRYDVPIAWGIFMFLLCAEARYLYGSWRLAPLGQEAVEIFEIWSVVLLGLVILAFLTKTTATYSRVTIATWFVLAPAGLIAVRIAIRMVLRELRKRGRNTRTLAIAGAGKVGQRLADSVLRARWTGLRIVGFFDDRDSARLNLDHRIPCVREGNLADLLDRAHSGDVDYVYITLPMTAESRIVKLVDALSDTTASVYIVPDLFVFDLVHAKWTSFDGIPMVSIFDSPFYGFDGWLKRLEDVALGVLILAMCAIPMLMVAAAIKLTSPGPVIFRQRRYGLDGKIVEVWKFRTMTVCEDGETIAQARRNDPRVTRFGAFLRRNSIDELPQFINVLRGSMSIVGPRPHAVAHNEQYRRLIRGYMLRHKVKPGITGWAQINGWRGETDTLEKMQKRVEFDMEYLQNWSLWLDLKIVALTAIRGFFRSSAY